MWHEDGKRIIQKVWYNVEFGGPLLTRSDLLSQGWTASEIKKKLGEPDCYGLNPQGGSYVLLYSEARVRRTKMKVVR